MKFKLTASALAFGAALTLFASGTALEIGRASCRERV